MWFTLFSDDKRPESIGISSLPGNKYGTSNSEKLQLSDKSSKTKSTEQEKQKHGRLSTSAAPNSEAKDTEIQKELHREIRRRENAEDWAEFLTLELDAHIQACVKAEQQYRQLFVKLDPASQEIFTGKLFLLFCKSKDFTQIVLQSPSWNMPWILHLTRNCEVNYYSLNQQIIVVQSKLLC